MAEDWKRLGRLVKQARLRKYRSRDDFAAATDGQVSTRTLGSLERGKRVSPFTLAQVEPALGWPSGSCDTVLAGGPAPVGVAAAEGDPEMMSAAEVLAWVDSERGLSRQSKAAIRAIVEELERGRRRDEATRDD